MNGSDRALVFWSTSVGGLLLADIALHKLYPDDPFTLSAQIRTRAQVEHPLGEAAFIGIFGAFVVWFGPHIVRPARLARRARQLARTIS